VLSWFAGPDLRLEAGRASLKDAFQSRFGRRARYAGVAVLMTACLLLSWSASPGLAQESTAPAVTSQIPPEAERSPLSISIDVGVKSVKVTDKILFNTTVTNHGSETTAPLILAMNIINLKGTGDPVDPEDWSPQRTQYIESLPPGQSATHAWRINAILDGDFIAYMVVLPEPKDAQSTSLPVASSGIHLTVAPYTKLNPSGVLPYVVATPIVLILLMVYLFRRRRREIDTGGATAS